MFNSMKEIATYLMEVSIDTGYAYGYIAECVDDLVHDGVNYEDAAHEIADIAYEYDL